MRQNLKRTIADVAEIVVLIVRLLCRR